MVIAHSQYQKSKRISIFLSMQDEIETEEIIRDIFQQGKTCFIPRYQFNSNHMDMVKLASPEEISSLPKTSWNIHQPGEEEVREEALSTGSLLSNITSKPTGIRVCKGEAVNCSSVGPSLFIHLPLPVRNREKEERIRSLTVLLDKNLPCFLSNQDKSPKNHLSSLKHF
nr:5-formyltetrahydrofolate cyclo-ligase isoform X3 [Equus asinus]